MIGLIILTLLLQGPRKLEIGEDKKIEPPLVVPAGTAIPIRLTNRISTKNAKDGDGIYGKTAFPVTVDNKIVIPEGSSVRGRIVEVVRPGRVKGKAEIALNFHTLVLPSGITIPIYTSLGGSSDAGEREGEATIKGESSKGKDAGDIGKSAGGGAVVGVLTRGAKGGAVGAGVGAAAGAIGVLLSRGSDLVLEPGTIIEIVLDRPAEP